MKGNDRIEVTQFQVTNENLYIKLTLKKPEDEFLLWKSLKAENNQIVPWDYPKKPKHLKYDLHEPYGMPCIRIFFGEPIRYHPYKLYVKEITFMFGKDFSPSLVFPKLEVFCKYAFEDDDEGYLVAGYIPLPRGSPVFVKDPIGLHIYGQQQIYKYLKRHKHLEDSIIPQYVKDNLNKRVGYSCVLC